MSGPLENFACVLFGMCLIERFLGKVCLGWFALVEVLGETCPHGVVGVLQGSW